MNREAVALGVTAYTTFAGRMGAIDELLVGDGRLRVLTSADAIELTKRTTSRAAAEARDTALMLDLMLSALDR
jgi:predicted glycosyltransferase